MKMDDYFRPGRLRQYDWIISLEEKKILEKTVKNPPQKTTTIQKGNYRCTINVIPFLLGIKLLKADWHAVKINHIYYLKFLKQIYLMKP